MALLHLEPAAHLDGYWGKVCGWAFFIWNLSSILMEIEERTVVGFSLSSLFSSEFDKGASGEFGVSRFWYVLEEFLMWRFPSFQIFRLLISHAYFLVSNVKWFLESSKFLKSWEILEILGKYSLRIINVVFLLFRFVNYWLAMHKRSVTVPYIFLGIKS